MGTKKTSTKGYYIAIGVLITIYILTVVFIFFLSKLSFEKRITILVTMVSGSISIIISILASVIASIKQVSTYETQKEIDKTNKWENMKKLLVVELKSNQNVMQNFLKNSQENSNKDDAVRALQQLITVKLWESSIEYIGYNERNAELLFKTYRNLNDLKTGDVKGIGETLVEKTLEKVNKSLEAINSK